MVVFEDGLPKRSDYRKFAIKGVRGQDDFASMDEMLRRRFTRLLEERSRPPGEPRRVGSRTRRRLVVVDGGRGQLAQASAVLAELGLSIPHIGLAKRLEEVYFPDRPDPLMIPRGLGGAVRPAAHPRRGPPVRRPVPPPDSGRSARCASPLDDIAGVGPARKKALLQAVRVARPAAGGHGRGDRRRRPGIGPELAAAIHEHLHARRDRIGG